jgi:DNA topoisomerase-1
MASATVSSTRPDPVDSAAAAGLRYVTDTEPGIRRQRRGKGFGYFDAQGRTVRDEETLARIRRLAIPPAWTDVWISTSPRGHLQASGRDQKGRKQYRYHAEWRRTRDQTKYERMIAFARALPRIRQGVERDLARAGLPREKVLALVTRLLELTLIRVGNEEYQRQNSSFGLTTLRDHHLQVAGPHARFRFVGKAGRRHAVSLSDARLAKLLKRCQDLPGQVLFQYLDEQGQPRTVSSDDVNAYLRELAGEDFTAKDFRTWAGTVLAAWVLQELLPFRTQKEAKKNLVRAVERVAERLGNTPSVCRKCYVHPAVLDSYIDGSLVQSLKARAARELSEAGGLPPEERAVVRLLLGRLEREARGRRGPRSRRAATAAA